MARLRGSRDRSGWWRTSPSLSRPPTEERVASSILLSGPPGWEWALSKLIAREGGSSFKTAQGPSLVDLGALIEFCPISKGLCFVH
jgi:hypothetical protein